MAIYTGIVSTAMTVYQLSLDDQVVHVSILADRMLSRYLAA